MQHLRSDWVDAIFTRLSVRYGSEWVRKWDGVDIAAVKADWASELAGLASNPDAIKHALAHLPADRPPTVTQFRALCIGTPEIAVVQLKGPASSSQVVNAAVSNALSAQTGHNGGKDWARRLRKREQLGERLSPVQRAFWREALRDAA